MCSHFFLDIFIDSVIYNIQIVVPILKGSQYFLLLLNMKLRMVQWIDNVNHTAVSEEEIRKLGDTMVCVAFYYPEKPFAYVAKIMKYLLINI